MTQSIFFFNNSCSVILVLILYCITYYSLHILYTFTLKNNVYIPFSSSNFDEIPIMDID